MSKKQLALALLGAMLLGLLVFYFVKKRKDDQKDDKDTDKNNNGNTSGGGNSNDKVKKGLSVTGDVIDVVVNNI